MWLWKSIFNTSDLSVIFYFFYQLLCKQSLQFVDVEDDDSEEEDDNPNPGNSTPDAADFSFSSLHKVKRDRNIDMDLDKISTCPLCHLALPVKTLEWHEVLTVLYIVIF